jgi:hypothetical protein
MTLLEMAPLRRRRTLDFSLERATKGGIPQNVNRKIGNLLGRQEDVPFYRRERNFKGYQRK